MLGDPNAPVTVTEFVDLQCPICANASRTVAAAVIRDYVRTGEVKLQARTLSFIGPDSVRAARVAAGAEQQGKLWPFLEAFYAKQGAENSGYVTDDFLRDVAAAARRRRGCRADVRRLGRTSQKPLDARERRRHAAEDRRHADVHRAARRRPAAGRQRRPARRRARAADQPLPSSARSAANAEAESRTDTMSSCVPANRTTAPPSSTKPPNRRCWRMRVARRSSAMIVQPLGEPAALRAVEDHAVLARWRSPAPGCRRTRTARRVSAGSVSVMAQVCRTLRRYLAARMTGRPPNILYLHSHDTGRYLEPYGYPVPTPNIQQLAEPGDRCSARRSAPCRPARGAAPRCSPGQYGHNNGMLGLAHRGWVLNDYGAAHRPHAARGRLLVGA